jgi:penicillin-insensitive murein DD-endopeptidase
MARFVLGLWGLCGLCAVAQAEPAVGTPSSPQAWNAVRQPAPWTAESIGGYSAGCLAGASQLPPKGAGYVIARPERGRVWGHPSLISFLEQLGARAKQLKLPAFFIGDLAQPRGGPAPSGHASHQTGLDVDVAYGAMANGELPSMLDGKKQPGKLFTAKVVRLLQLAAADPRVDRMFVNPAIKRALCQASGDRAWLRKLRPWWGHHAHFHVRLACPERSAECVPQPALPAGDGCGELDWWFSREQDADRGKAQDAYSAKVGGAPELPARCNSVLDAK